MIMIILLMVVIIILVINKNGRECININGGSVTHRTEVGSMSDISIVKDADSVKTIYLITQDHNVCEDCHVQIKDIIRNFLKSKQDSMLIVSNWDDEELYKNRVIVDNTENKSKPNKKFDNADVQRVVTTSYGKIIIYRDKKEIESIETGLKKAYPDMTIESYSNPIPNEVLIKELDYKP